MTKIEALHAKKWFKFAGYDDSYIVFTGRKIQTHGIVVKTNHSELGKMDKIQQPLQQGAPGAETLSCSLAILSGTKVD